MFRRGPSLFGLVRTTLREVAHLFMNFRQQARRKVRRRCQRFASAMYHAKALDTTNQSSSVLVDYVILAAVVRAQQAELTLAKLLHYGPLGLGRNLTIVNVQDLINKVDNVT